MTGEEQLPSKKRNSYYLFSLIGGIYMNDVQAKSHIRSLHRRKKTYEDASSNPLYVLVA